MKKKLLKIVSTSTLAVIMGAGVLCGTIIPINSPQTAMSGASTAGATASSNAGDLATRAQLGDSALNASGGATQENLVAGEAIQLNPKNDPVVYTTETGIEIKEAKAISNISDSCYYFEMGEYNDSPLPWVIIAQGTGSYSTGTGTPALEAIKKDGAKQVFANIPQNNEVPAGQFLCFLANPINRGQVSVNYSQGAYTKQGSTTYTSWTISCQNNHALLSQNDLSLNSSSIKNYYSQRENLTNTNTNFSIPSNEQLFISFSASGTTKGSYTYPIDNQWQANFYVKYTFTYIDALGTRRSTTTNIYHAWASGYMNDSTIRSTGKNEYIASGAGILDYLQRPAIQVDFGIFK